MLCVEMETASRQWVKRKTPTIPPRNAPPPQEWGGGGVGHPPTQNFQDTNPSTPTPSRRTDTKQIPDPSARVKGYLLRGASLRGFVRDLMPLILTKPNNACAPLPEDLHELAFVLHKHWDVRHLWPWPGGRGVDQAGWGHEEVTLLFQLHALQVRRVRPGDGVQDPHELHEICLGQHKTQPPGGATRSGSGGDQTCHQHPPHNATHSDICYQCQVIVGIYVYGESFGKELPATKNMFHRSFASQLQTCTHRRGPTAWVGVEWSGVEWSGVE